MRTRLTAISFGLAVAAAVFLLVWPVYSGFNGDRATHATLLQINGWWAVVPVMFPVLVALVPLVLRRCGSSPPRGNPRKSAHIH